MIRRLVKDARFGIADGPEEHYLDIRARGGKIVGKVDAPLFHSYTYYMPYDPDKDYHFPHNDGWFKDHLTELAKMAAFVGPSHAVACFLGMYTWAETESLFARYVAKAVTFGRSHVDFFICGYGLGLVGKTSLPTSLLAAWYYGLNPDVSVWEAFLWWQRDGFALVSPSAYLGSHRVDHFAHIGGIVAGFFLSRYVSRNVKKGTWDLLKFLY